MSREAFVEENGLESGIWFLPAKSRQTLEALPVELDHKFPELVVFRSVERIVDSASTLGPRAWRATRGTSLGSVLDQVDTGRPHD